MTATLCKRQQRPASRPFTRADGRRIGEALALRHGPTSDGRPLLDVHPNTWAASATAQVSGE